MAEFGEIEKAIELTMRHIAYAAGWRRLAQRTVALEPRGERPAGREHRRGSPQAGRVARAARLIDDTRGIGQVLANFGWVELLEGDFEHASSYFEEVAAIARRLGARWLSADAIWGFAEVAAAAGDADRAARLAGAALAFGGSTGVDLTV